MFVDTAQSPFIYGLNSFPMNSMRLSQLNETEKVDLYCLQMKQLQTGNTGNLSYAADHKKIQSLNVINTVDITKNTKHFGMSSKSSQLQSVRMAQKGSGSPDQSPSSISNFSSEQLSDAAKKIDDKVRILNQSSCKTKNNQFSNESG